MSDQEILKELLDTLEKEGYYSMRVIEGRGICGLHDFMFTTGLIYGIDESGYVGRYCFTNKADAEKALNEWNGKGDPIANWVKHKGHIEYSNHQTQPPTPI